MIFNTIRISYSKGQVIIYKNIFCNSKKISNFAISKNLIGLENKQNFYYCRSERDLPAISSLENKQNFYYCRSQETLRGRTRV